MLQGSTYNYNIYFDFIKENLSTGFEKINPDDPTMQKIEKITTKNNQFITASDLTALKYIYASKQCKHMLGVESEDLDRGFFMHNVHPDDLERLSLGRVKMIKVAQELFAHKEGTALMSFTLRIRNPHGTYNHLMGQAYFFYSSVPRNAVFLIQVITNVDWCKSINPDGHYFIGNDLSLFKYPDSKLLQIGSKLSAREFEIVKWVAFGMNSKQIAEKLYLSMHTVSTHRANILKKTGKNSIADVIIEFKHLGLL